MYLQWKRLAALALACVSVLTVTGCGTPEQVDTAPVVNTAAVVTEATLPAVQADSYTYRDSVREMPTCWNPQQWQTEADAYVMNLTGSGLYSIALREDGTGYAFQPEMAVGEPVDVTAAYVGSQVYGVPADAAEGYAYRIDLNPDACWEDGTPIDADTYLDSMEKMLSSEAKNPRAAGYYSGQLCIANAYAYFMQDQVGTSTYCTLAEAGYGSVAEAANDGIEKFYLDMNSFWGLDCGWVSITSMRNYRDEAVRRGQKDDYVSARYLYETYLADGMAYSAYQTAFVGIPVTTVEKTDFSQVGLLKTGTYQITLVLAKPISPEALQCCLTTGWLVRADADPFGYCTSVETSASYGPYRLTALGTDDFRLERNETWYGYTDGKHLGQYQSTAVYCRVLTEEEARVAFDQGLLDTLTTNEKNDGAQVTPQAYVSKLTFNTSLTALKLRQSQGINKSILYYRDFRNALSLSIDRQAFVEACGLSGEPALGLLSDAFVSDLAAGEAYRNSQAGQAVLEAVYGGETPSGYDPERAAALFQRAYDAAREDGNLGSEDVVELEFLVYGEDAVYTAMAAFLQDAFSTAAVGTSLENRIRIVTTVNPDYYTAARNGQFDIILSTWGGAASDPFSMMRCYCAEEKRFEYGFEPNVENCTILLGDVGITKTYRGWYEALVNGKYAGAENETRCRILSGLERALLESYHCVPLYQRNRFTLDSGRVTRPSAQGVLLADVSDVRYAAYTSDDAAWEKQTGVLF